MTWDHGVGGSNPPTLTREFWDKERKEMDCSQDILFIMPEDKEQLEVLHKAYMKAAKNCQPVMLDGQRAIITAIDINVNQIPNGINLVIKGQGIEAMKVQYHPDQRVF